MKKYFILHVPFSESFMLLFINALRYEGLDNYVTRRFVSKSNCIKYLFQITGHELAGNLKAFEFNVNIRAEKEQMHCLLDLQEVTETQFNNAD